MSSKLLVMFFVIFFSVSVITTTLPASNALVNNDYGFINDNQLTAMYGNTMVCGDHMCKPGEWNKLQGSLTAAQLSNQIRNSTQSNTVPSSQPSTNATSSAMPTGATEKLCASVKAILLGSGVSAAILDKVMADLGCS